MLTDVILAVINLDERFLFLHHLNNIRLFNCLLFLMMIQSLEKH